MIVGVVLYQRPDGTTGSCIVHGLESAVDETASYYRELDYRIVRRALDDVCDPCQGQGSVPKRSRWERKICPSCKGDPIREIKSW